MATEEAEKKSEKEEVKGGELLFCGATAWDVVGRKKGGIEGNLYAPTRLRPLVGIDIRFVASGCAACHCVALDVDGRCYTWGRNDKGQLGHGDKLPRDRPTVVSELSKYRVVKAGSGRGHTVVSTEDGLSFAFGWNKHGQLGTGSLKNEFEGSPVRCQVADVTNVACGADFTVWLTSVAGSTILTAGLPQYGQLGHGTDNEYNTKDSSVRLAYEPQSRPKPIAMFAGETIVKVACGANHTVAVDSNGHVYTWGFGGYGRLGHREQKDEFSPRRVDIFQRQNALPPDAVISAGGVNSACTAAGGQLYMWGKLKITGDDWMYPKPHMDLSGWNLRCMDSGAMHHFVGADSSCISWGHAQNGELGYGPNAQKSSAMPKKVDSLEGMHVLSVACGFAHSMVVVDRAGVGDRLEQLDIYDGKAADEVTEVVETPSSARKPAAKRGAAAASTKSNKKKKQESSESEQDSSQEQNSDSDEDDSEESSGEANGDVGKKGKRGGRSAAGRGRGRAKGTPTGRGRGGRPPAADKKSAQGGRGKRGRPRKSDQ